MREVSPEMIDDLFDESAQRPVLLLTLTAPGLPESMYLCNLDGGITSREQFYEYFPFTFTPPGSAEDSPIREARLEIFNRDGRISNAIRVSTGSPRVTVEYVKLSDPDFVELALTDAEIYDVEIDSPKVTATIRAKSYALEPACKARYIAARTPGLF